MVPSALPSLRWGLIGASRIARNALVPAFRAAGQTLVGVAARDPVRAQDFAATMGIDRSYASYAELIADPTIEAVYISLVNDGHLPWAQQALASGKHVLCEKPLALSAEDVETMRRAEASGGGVLMEAFCHIFHPRFDDLLALVAAGKLGRLVSIEASFSNPMTDPDDYRHSKAMGGGAVYDLAGYCVSLAWLLAGRAPTTASARFQPLGEVDGSAAMLLDFGTSQALIAVSLTAAAQQRLTVNGTAGTLTLDWPISNKNRAVSLDIAGERRDYAPGNPYQAMVEDFVAGATGQRQLKFGSGHALTQARILDAIFASAASGNVVEVVS